MRGLYRDAYHVECDHAPLNVAAILRGVCDPDEVFTAVCRIGGLYRCYDGRPRHVFVGLGLRVVAVFQMARHSLRFQPVGLQHDKVGIRRVRVYPVFYYAILDIVDIAVIWHIVSVCCTAFI